MGLSWQVLKEYLEDNAVEKGIPLSGAFELTGRCNLNCKMCYVHTTCNNKARIDELSVKDWIKFGKAAVEQGMLELLLTGGEVFLREDFREIYEGLSELGLLITIYTNGTLITPEITSWLVQVPPKKIEISLYGATAETYKKVCGDPSGLSRALNGIDMLQSCGIPLELRTTLTPDNYMEFESIAKLAEDRKLKLGIVNYLSPQRDVKSSELYRLAPEKLVEVEDRVNSYYDAWAKRNEEESWKVDNNKSKYNKSKYNKGNNNKAFNNKEDLENDESLSKDNLDKDCFKQGNFKEEYSGEGNSIEENLLVGDLYKCGISEGNLKEGNFEEEYIFKENANDGDFFDSNFGKGNFPEVLPQCAYGCTSGKSSFNITYDGRMTPCGLSGDIATFPLKQGFKLAWENLRQLCNSTPQCPDCITCDFKSFCMTCPTRLKNETNSYTQKSPYLCELAKLHYQRSCQR